MTGDRLSRLGVSSIVLAAMALIAGCSSKVSCDDSRVIAQVVDFTERGAERDLAYQCERKLHAEVPQLKAACDGDAAHSDACLQACKSWAAEITTAKVDSVVPSFSDSTVALQSCKAKVHYTIDFNGGQTVDATVTYFVRPELSGPVVEVSR